MLSSLFKSPNTIPRWTSSFPILLSLALQVTSRSDVIETSSVSYCSTPRAIIIDTFDVRYYKSNNSLGFDLSAASVSTGLNLDAQLSLTVYGLNSLNLSIDLCSVLSGVLCPLPTYNFTGSGGYTIPPENVPSITGLAWVVPDIEAVITVVLTDTNTNEAAACLQVTLTNGLTVGLASVSWPTAAVLILSFALATIHPFQFGIIFLLLGNQLQHMAMSGMMSLNYPTVFRTWTTNFAYAIGLIKSDAISRAVDRLRKATGGNGFTTAQDLVAFTSRYFSPYNQASGSMKFEDTSPSLASRTAISNLLATTNVLMANNVDRKPLGELIATTPRSDYVVPVVTNNTTLLDPGLSAYVNELGFPVENAFTVVFMWTIILIALGIAITALVVVFLRVRQRNWHTPLQTVSQYISPVGLKALLFVWPPITLFTCFQWRLGSTDAWLPILLSVILWLACTLALGWVCWTRFKVRNHSDVDNVHLHERFSIFKPNRWWAFFPWGILCFVKVAVIGFGQGWGERQVIATIVLEALLLIFLVATRPFQQTRFNVLAIILGVLQLIEDCILVTFVPRQEIKPIPRAILGFVLIGIQSIGFIIIFGYTLVILVLRAQFLFKHQFNSKNTGVADAEKEQFTFEPKPNETDHVEPEHQPMMHNRQLSEPDASTLHETPLSPRKD
ncbi:hypothetical protein DFH28DRAFT_903125 [Melampsora americana]|nr:hypothetical protein DFH28DRAFT_903125 [Melampsora americana]